MDLLFNQATEDLVLAGGDLDISDETNTDAMQMLYLRLKTFKREWFWDITYGIDFLNDVMGLNRSKNSVDIIFRREIQKEILVSEILSFESKIENYSYSLKFTVSIVDEDVPLQFYIILNEDSLTITNEDGLSLVTLL